jgi:hypothetical protein
MATSVTYGRGLGIARIYALIFGIAYLAVALTEVVLGSAGLVVGNAVILKVTVIQNAIHWLTGLVVLGSFFTGEIGARLVARIVGIVFVLVTLLGLFVEPLTGQLLGFPGALPMSYNLVHLLTAAAALFAGFAAQRAYGQA